MNRFVMRGLTCLALVTPPLWAQEPPAARPDPIAAQVIAPELILQNQKAIGLSEAQRTSVINEVKRTQSRMVDLQWDLQRAVERMAELLGQPKIDEASAVAQLDKVLAIEREIKQMHIALVVRLKNQLTPDQQRQLRELGAAAGGPRR